MPTRGPAKLDEDWLRKYADYIESRPKRAPFAGVRKSFNDRRWLLENLMYSLRCRFEYTEEPVDSWRVPQNWKQGPIRDDCDGFAMAAKELLLDVGIPESDLRLCVCRDGNAGHMCLAVECSDRTVIIDNQAPDSPWDWRVFGYKWLFREDGEGGFEYNG
jgi:hypothetical protein